MDPIRSIADIPFRERDVLELLNLDQERDAPDLDYCDFGYARARVVSLESRGHPEPLPLVRDALILGLHAAEEPEVLDRDIELEFFIDEVAEDYSVTALLSAFLDAWLPRLTGGERAIILVLCNPHDADIPRPAAAGATPVYYALGDVDSWLDIDDGSSLVRLVADEWRMAS